MIYKKLITSLILQLVLRDTHQLQDNTAGPVRQIHIRKDVTIIVLAPILKSMLCFVFIYAFKIQCFSYLIERNIKNTYERATQLKTMSGDTSSISL